MLLGRASSDVPQGPFRETRNPRHRVEFIRRIVDAFWKTWTRDVLPLLAPRRKWNVDRRNVQVDDVVMMADANSVRGKWTIARVMEVYPEPDGKTTRPLRRALVFCLQTTSYSTIFAVKIIGVLIADAMATIMNRGHHDISVNDYYAAISDKGKLVHFKCHRE